MKRRTGEPDWILVERALARAGVDLSRVCELLTVPRDGWPAVGHLRRSLVRLAVQALGVELRDKLKIGDEQAASEAARRIGVRWETHLRECARDRKAARARVQTDKTGTDSPGVLSLPGKGRVA